MPQYLAVGNERQLPYQHSFFAATVTLSAATSSMLFMASMDYPEMDKMNVFWHTALTSNTAAIMITLTYMGTMKWSVSIIPSLCRN